MYITVCVLFYNFVPDIKTSSMNAIILSRVSTQQQNLDKQTEDLKAYAKKHGYKKPIVIEYKESAIKLSEDERAGINDMKHYIEAGNVNAVFIWELSRLSRRATDLYLLRDYFSERHVQLYCFKPEFKLFDDNWNIDATAGITFAIFNTLAEQEMTLKKERQIRGKKRNSELGKYNGGKIRFGYKVDENGFYVVNEPEAKIIRKIFELYSDGNHSLRDISTYLASMGTNLKMYYLSKLLKDKAVLGGLNTIYTGFTRTYPQIISQDLFDKVQNVLKGNLNKPKTTSNYHLCAKLITCPVCGHSYTYARNAYHCAYHYFKDINIELCSNTCTIDAKLIDTLIWKLVSKFYVYDLMIKNSETEKKLENELSELKQKISVVDGKIGKIQGKMDRINELYINESISAQKYKSYKISVKDERSSYMRQKQLYIESEQNISDTLKVIKERNSMPSDKLFNALDNVNEMDNVQRYEIVHQYVKDISVEYIDDAKKDKIITITMVTGDIKSYIKYYRNDKLIKL